MPDFSDELTAISDLASATWKYRDVLLARQGLTQEVVQLEDAAIKLWESLATLKAAIQK